MILRVCQLLPSVLFDSLTSLETHTSFTRRIHIGFCKVAMLDEPQLDSTNPTATISICLILKRECPRRKWECAMRTPSLTFRSVLVMHDVTNLIQTPDLEQHLMK